MTTTTSERPWPVVLLTALGAWLATIPLDAQHQACDSHVLHPDLVKV